MQNSPFKFLDSYSKEDRDIFFGRDKEIEELHTRVFESKILVVYGISGTGKSSLINCGLANKFNDSDWLPVSIRRGLNINHSLLESLSKASLSGVLSGKPVSAQNKKPDIVRLLRSVYLDEFKPVYLIFDQFEELFIFGNKEEKDELIDNIKRVIDSDLQCRFIFSVREEYLASITEFERVIPTFLNNRIRIEKMTRQNAIQAIEGPCKVAEIDLEAGFAEALLQKLNPDSADVELTYLQVFLDRILRLATGYLPPSIGHRSLGEGVGGGQGGGVKTNREGQRIAFTISLLSRAGNVSDLLGTFLEEQISQLEDHEKGLAVLKSFVSVKGTRHQITEEEVIEYSETFGEKIDSESAKGLIQRFIGLRILRDKNENGRYELRHDSLATKIYEKITLVEKELLEVRQFVENAISNFEKRYLFLTADDLKYIAPYEDKLFLNEKIIRFISQSKWEIQKARRRRQNVLITAVAIIMTVLSFFTIWALRERGNALRQKHYADVQKNEAISAKEAADSAKQTALISKNLAIENENKAVLAQKQSEEAKKTAVTEREYALAQRSLAEKLAVTANEQAKVANEEKSRAEQEREKAIAAEANAKRLNLLSIAQTLALKSYSFNYNPQLMGLLVLQAYNFNINNGGKPDDPVIWGALDNSYSSLDSSKHSLYSGSPNEIYALASREGTIISADLDGQLRSWNQNGICKNITKLDFLSPVNLIAAATGGEWILTQHDNQDLLLWDTRKLGTNRPGYLELKGHKNFIRAICFSQNKELLATAGLDSMIIIWNLDTNPISKTVTVKANSQVRSVVFVNDNSIVSAQENGCLALWDINKATCSVVYSSTSSRPLCLAFNGSKKLLLAGCSDGTMLSFQIISEKPAEPVKYFVHTAGIDLITFSNDFSLLATSSWDKTIKLYNYNEFFELGNTVGGVVHIKDLNSRVRSMIFTNDDKLAAGISDKSIRIWETSSSKLARSICVLAGRNMTQEEWKDMVGAEVPYQKTCGKNP